MTKDGKRFLANIRTDSPVRVVWLKADGTGKPDFVSLEGEVGYGGRLSPDSKHVLYHGGPEPTNGERAKVRLYAMDLATKKRTAVDEPGETHGHCWSPDGSFVEWVARRERRLHSIGSRRGWRPWFGWFPRRASRSTKG